MIKTREEYEALPNLSEIKNKVMVDYRNGNHDLEELSKSYGYPIFQIINWVKSIPNPTEEEDKKIYSIYNNTKKERTEYKYQLKKELSDYYNSGFKKIEELSEKFAVPAPTIYVWLKEERAKMTETEREEANDSIINASFRDIDSFNPIISKYSAIIESLKKQLEEKDRLIKVLQTTLERFYGIDAPKQEQ